jgi:outer membrane autotransporter protein
MAVQKVLGATQQLFSLTTLVVVLGGAALIANADELATGDVSLGDNEGTPTIVGNTAAGTFRLFEGEVVGLQFDSGVIVGNLPTGDGTADLQDASQWTIQDDSASFLVGLEGTGRLDMQGGSNVAVQGFDSASVIFGSNTGSSGFGDLDEASSLTLFGSLTDVSPQTATLVVGGAGEGSLEIRGGSTVDVSDDGAARVQVGNSGGSGRLNVSGVDSNLSISGATSEDYSLRIGQLGSGTVTLSDQATVNIDDSVDAGVAIGSGAGGEGSLSILGGAQMTVMGVGDAQFVLVGGTPEVAGGMGTLEVEGAGSGLFVEGLNPAVAVGANGGQATADVSDGGLLQLQGIDDGEGNGGGTLLEVGRQGSNGALTVTGSGSQVEMLGVDSGLASFVDVGGDGTGTLNVLDGATLDVLGAGESVSVLRAGGEASGNGAIVVSGAGSALNVSNNLTGSSSENGLIAIGQAGSGTMRISDGATVSNSAIGSSIVGGQPGGTGTVTVTGPNSIWGAGQDLFIGIGESDGEPVPGGTGTVTVANGGRIAADDVTVGPGGTLAGDGTVAGNVTNAGGTLAPGLSPGTLTIEGDLELQEGDLLIEVAGTESGEFDVIDVSGTANVDGGTARFVYVNGFAPRADAQLSFLNAFTIVGFDNLEQDFTGLPRGIYDLDINSAGDAVVFFASPLLLRGTGGPGSNQESVGDAILAASATATGQLAADLNLIIDGQEAGEPGARDAVDALTADDAYTATQQGRAGLKSQTSNVSNRTANLRAGVSGVDLTGLALNYSGQTFDGGELGKVAWGVNQGGAASSDLDFGPWGVFVSGSLASGEWDETRNQAGFDLDTAGLTVGADYRINDRFVLGAALGYNNSEADISRDGGSVDSDGYSISAYGTYYQSDEFYLDGSLTYGKMNFDQERNIRYTIGSTAVNQVASSDYDGDDFGAHLGGGYQLSKGPWTYGPVARLDYDRVETDGYQESMSNPSAPGGALPVDIESQTWKSLIAGLGGEVSYAMSQSWGVLIPQARLEYIHQIEDDAREITGDFVSDTQGNTFVIRTDDPDRNYFNLQLAVSAQFAQGRAAYLNFEQVLGNDQFDWYEVTAGVRFEF